MNQILSLFRLDAIKGSRTQYTVLVMAVINCLVSLKIIHLTPDDLETTNKFLTMIGAYFFAEKISEAKK